MKFSFVLSATGNLSEVSYHESCLCDVIRGLKEIGIDYTISEIGDSEYSYCAREAGGGAEVEGQSWWAGIQDVDASGIISKEQMKSLCCSIGAYPSGSQTLGTLGGPLGLGICWDVDFTCESTQLILCLRVTPIPERGDREIERVKNPDKAIERLEKALISTAKTW